MQLLFFHGEAILIDFLKQCLLGLLATVACVYGLVKYRSVPATVVAFAYFAITCLCALLYFRAGISSFGSFALALTLPWNLIMPCFDFYTGPCRLSLAGAFICAGLNAAVIYYVVVWIQRGK